jgi:hypothetical protein
MWRIGESNFLLLQAIPLYQGVSGFGFSAVSLKHQQLGKSAR